jgi:hypothetical protein
MEKSFPELKDHSRGYLDGGSSYPGILFRGFWDKRFEMLSHSINTVFV